MAQDHVATEDEEGCGVCEDRLVKAVSKINVYLMWMHWVITTDRRCTQFESESFLGLHWTVFTLCRALALAINLAMASEHESVRDIAVSHSGKKPDP